MRYFTVRAENIRNQTVKEVDIPARQLLPFFKAFEFQLREDGIFTAKEVLLKRIVPTVNAGVDAVQVQIFKKDATELGELEYDVYVDGAGQEDAHVPLGSLSLWFCSVETSRVCSITLPVSLLFHATEDDLKHEMVTHGSPSEDVETWRFQVFLSGEGLLYIPRMHRSKTLTYVVTLDDRKTAHDEEGEQESRPVDVKITERKSLIIPGRRAWDDYNASIVGIRQRGDLRILMNKQAVDRVWSSLAEYAQLVEHSQVFEMGGFLLGNVFLDEEEKTFIDIDTFAIVDTRSQFSFTSLLRHSPDLLQESIQRIKEVYPDKKRLGWYHAHLIHVRSRSLLKSERAASILDFSSSDKDLHRSLFREPWQVAMVIDIEKHKFDFYQWKRNEVEPCHGFYIYEL